MKKKTKNFLKEFLNKAEGKANAKAEKFKNFFDLSCASTINLLEDLRTQQKEIELCNDKLHQKQVEIELSRNRYKELYEKQKKVEKEIKTANDKLKSMNERNVTELNKFKAIAENANYGMTICDLNGIFKYVNKYSANIHGYEPDELIDKNISIYHNKEQLKTVKKLNKQLLNHGSYNAQELWHKHKDGKCFTMLMNGFIINNKENNELLLSYTSVDISNIKYLQTQLLRSERLASTGKLAASIAHEINSPLQGITFMLSSLRRKNKYDSKDIDLLNGAFNNIKKTVKNLLDLHRPSKELKQLINVNDIIKQTLDLVKSYLKKSKIKTQLNLSSQIPNIIASPQQLSQVFINIINNAIEAMTGESETNDSLKSIISNHGKITISTNLESEKIIIVFTDTGPGFEEDDKYQIFDPFYTQKQKNGLGIGLSICHSIINDHNGSIDATNLPDKGSRFTILLPIK